MTTSFEVLIPMLITQCIAKVKEFNAQEVSNCLWSIATLELSNKNLVNNLFTACIFHVNDMNPKALTICIWAVATLGDDFVNDHVIQVLLEACTLHLTHFSALQVSMTFWSIAFLGVSDKVFVQKTLSIIEERMNDFSPRQVCLCLFGIASLGIEITDLKFFHSIIKVCLIRCHEFNIQDIASCLWSLSTLDQIYLDEKECRLLCSSLLLAINTRYSTIERVMDAKQCLQAHYMGMKMCKEAVVYFHLVLAKNPSSKKSTKSQVAVSSALENIGFLPKLEVPILDGLMSVDIVIDLPSVSDKRNEGSAATVVSSTKIAIEFDGPKHFMRKIKNSTDLVGSIDARTRLRNKLIKKSGEFGALLVIPFYEWDEVYKNVGGKQDDFRSENLSSSWSNRPFINYLQRKIQLIDWW
jgi:hypothetical protein